MRHGLVLRREPLAVRMNAVHIGCDFAGRLCCRKEVRREEAGRPEQLSVPSWLGHSLLKRHRQVGKVRQRGDHRSNTDAEARRGNSELDGGQNVEPTCRTLSRAAAGECVARSCGVDDGRCNERGDMVTRRPIVNHGPVRAQRQNDVGLQSAGGAGPPICQLRSRPHSRL